MKPQTGHYWRVRNLADFALQAVSALFGVDQEAAVFGPNRRVLLWNDGPPEMFFRLTSPRRESIWPEEQVLARRVGAVREIAETLATARTAFARAECRYADLAQRLGRPVSGWHGSRYSAIIASIVALAVAVAIVLAPADNSVRGNSLPTVVFGAGAAMAAHLAGRMLRQWRSRSSRAARLLVRSCGLGALLAAAAAAIAAGWYLGAPVIGVVALAGTLMIFGAAWCAHEPDPAFAVAELHRARAAALLCEKEARYEEGVAAARMAFDRLLAAVAARSGATAISAAIDHGEGAEDIAL